MARRAELDHVSLASNATENWVYKPKFQMAVSGAETRYRRLLGPTALRTGDVPIASLCAHPSQVHLHGQNQPGA